MLRVLALVSCLACSDTPSADSPAPTSELEEAVDFEDRGELAEQMREANEARAAAVETATEAQAEAEPAHPGPSDEAEAPPGFNRAVLGAYISIGDPVTAFPPGQVSYLRAGDSPYLLVTPNISEQRPPGYQVEMQLPDAASDDPIAAEDLHVKVNNEAGETFDVRGQVTFRSLDLSTGHVALVLEGETTADPPLSVEVEVDARLRVVEE